ncbi:MAG TPA: NAD(+) synthase [Firmicutes bacterium]|nr:NAD(+) synthase [Candidatus Fermentithermobacillaceae bacterium]
MRVKDIRQVAFSISDWMRKMSDSAGAAGGIFGVSGGLDSALLVALAKDAWQEDCLGLVLPCHSSETDVKDAIYVLEHFDCNYQVLDLTPVFDSFISILGESDAKSAFMARANLKPRLRMAALYYHANMMNYVVVGTTNRSEYHVGYFTKYGDGGVDMLPLANLTKTEVRQLSRFLGVPERILAKTPSGGLWEGQTDEGEMGLSYTDLDAYLRGEKVPPAVEARITEMHNKSGHKRGLPPIPVRSIDFFKGE